MTKKLDENKAALQKLRIALSGAGVEKTVADRFMELVERLQDDGTLVPEVLSIGEELAELLRQIDQEQRKRGRDIVAEMAASVLHVERVG